MDAPSPGLQRLSRFVPKSPKEMTLLRRRLTAAGYHGMDAVIVFSVAKVTVPVFTAGLVFALVGPSARSLVMAVLGGGLRLHAAGLLDLAIARGHARR